MRTLYKNRRKATSERNFGMSKPKYVVQNCPCFSPTCTNCVIKQIVELCKEDLKPVREWQEGDTIFVEYKKDVHLANDILQLLDIQEVE